MPCLRLVMGWLVGLVFSFSLVLHGTASAGIVRYGDSARVDYERLSVYSLKGTSREIGVAVGKLMPAGSLEEGMVPYMGRYVENMIYNMPAVRNNSFLRLLVAPLLDLYYYNSMSDRIHPDEKQYLLGLHEATGFNHDLLKHALLNPDVAHVMAADYLNGKLPIGPSSVEEDPVRGMAKLPQFGCSTFFMPAADTTTGYSIVGRVQDYPGVGRYDAYTSVHYIAKKGKYRYATMTTAGIAVGGITVLNEHGLVISMHSALTSDADSSRGSGLTTTGRMAEEARNIEEAVAVCNANIPASGWIINVIDVKEGVARAARIEINPKKGTCGVTYAEGFQATTNHYITEEGQRREIKLGPSIDENSTDRYKRLNMLLQEKAGRMDIRDAMTVLADRADLTLGRTATFSPGGVVALHQILSVIIIPETREFWISNGWSPPSVQGRYLHFRFEDLEHIESIPNKPTHLDVDIHSVLKGTENDLSDKPAYFQYLEAFRLLDSNSSDVNPGSAWNFLDRAAKMDPFEPIFRLARGMVSLRLEKFDLAISDLFQAQRSRKLDEHRRFVAKLYLAKALDVVGRRLEAKMYFLDLRDNPAVYAPIRRVATKYLDERYPARLFGNIDLDLRVVDTLGYD